MPWFAAHVVMYNQLTDGPQDRYTGYKRMSTWWRRTRRNRPSHGAASMAGRTGPDCSGTLTVDAGQARLTFAGVRKAVKVLHAPGSEQVDDGDEITYSEFEVADADHLCRFAAGDAVPLVSIE